MTGIMMMNHLQRSLEDLNFDMTISINKEETPEGTKFTMTKQIDFDRYKKFVDAVTSDASTDFVALSDRLVELDEKGANIERLLTAGVGINAEGGEFLEIIKKMIFQGKPFNEDNREHMIIELGDLMWYVIQACVALEVSFDEVIARNVKKLEKRYPGGAFDVYYSENRAEGDL